MATTDTERYVRLTLLMFEGGTWIAKEILLREVARESVSLSSLLERHKRDLKTKRGKKEITSKQHFILKETIRDENNLKLWDVQLLVKMILFLFDSTLPGHDKTAMTDILSIRNDLICHNSLPRIGEMEFFASWTKLTGCLYRLSSFKASVSQHVAQMIADLASGPLDLQSSILKVSQLCKNDEHMEDMVAALSRIEQTQYQVATGVQSANEKLDDLVDKVNELMKISGQDQWKLDIPILQSQVSISCKSEELVQLMQDILVKVFKAAVSTPTIDPTDVTAVCSAVRKFLNDLEGMGAKPVSSEKGSILLFIQCVSLQGLFELLNMYRKCWNRFRLAGIEAALTETYKEDIRVEMVLSEDSIEFISKWIDEQLSIAEKKISESRPHTSELTMEIRCDSLESVSQVADYFQNGGAANRLNQLSEALSASVNETVKVEATLNIEDFAAALSSARGDNEEKTGVRTKAMQCPECGVVADEASKFCQECGTKIIPKAAIDLVVICNGTEENGTLCGAELTAEKKFCNNCGQKVDIRLFKTSGNVETEGNTKQKETTDKALAPDIGQDATPANPVQKTENTPTSTGTGVQKGQIESTSAEIRNAKETDTFEKPENLDIIDITETDLNKGAKEPHQPVSSNNNALDSDNLGLAVKIKTMQLSSGKESESEATISENKMEVDEENMTKRRDSKRKSVEIKIVDSDEETIKKQKTSEVNSPKADPIESTNVEQVGQQLNADRVTQVNESEMRVPLAADMKQLKESEHQKKDLGDKSSMGNADIKLSSQEKEDESWEIFYDAPLPIEGNATTSGIEKQQDSMMSDHPSVERKNGNSQFVFGTGKPQVTADGQKAAWSNLFKTGKEETKSQTIGNSQSVSLNQEKGETSDDQHSTSSTTQKDPKLNDPLTTETDNADDETMDTEDQDKDSRSESDGDSTQDDQPMSRRSKRNAKKRIQKLERPKEGNKPAPKKATGTAVKQDTKSKVQRNINFYDKKVKIHFHVFVGEAFKFASKDKQLVLRGELFGWNENRHVLNVKRLWNSGKISEMETVIEVPLHKVFGQKRIKYKYYICSKEKHGKEKGEYEKYQVNHIYRDDHYNRSLYIPREWKEIEKWHQFDGFIERAPKTKFGRVVEYFGWNDSFIHMNNSTAAFCSSFFNDMEDNFTMQEALDKFEMLYICMRQIYYIDAKCWNTEEEYRKVITDNMIRPYLDNLPKTLSKLDGETVEMSELRIAKTLACIVLIKGMGAAPSSNTIKMLCESLLLKKDYACSSVKIQEKFFGRKRKELKEAVVHISKVCASQAKDPSWLFVMPWVHFLSDACKPHEIPEVDMGHDYRVPLWWGVSHIGEDTVKKFKERNSEWTISVTVVIEQLFPLFEMDYLLPRTLMAVVELKHLKQVIETGRMPLEICLAALNYYMKIHKPRMSYTGGWPNPSRAELTIGTCAESLLNQLKATHGRTENRNQLEMAYKIATIVLDESTQSNRGNAMGLFSQIAAYCIAIYDVTDDQTNASKSAKRAEHLTHLPKCTDLIKRWFRTNFGRWDYYMSDNLQIWNNTLVDNLPSKKVEEIWNEAVVSTLSTTLQNQVCRYNKETEVFVQLYCEKGDSFHQKMQDVLSNIAFEAIIVGYTVDYGRFTTQASQRYGMLLSNMFNTEWNKAVGDDNLLDNEKILRHILHWRPFLRFLKIYNGEQQKLNLLHEECVARIVLAVSDIELRLQALMDGTLPVGTLNIISSPNSTFHEIAVHVSMKNKYTEGVILKAIAVRKKEMEAFQDLAENMTTLTSLCQYLENVDIAAVDQVLQKQGDMDKHQVNEFVVPAAIDKVESVETYTPQVCAFPVTQVVLEVLPEITRCYKSTTFLNFWRHKCKEQGNQKLTLVDVIERIWTPVIDSWMKKTEEIGSGTITFQGMEKMIGRLYQDDYEKMAIEMRTMGISEEVTNTRLDQLRQYRQLENCVKGARVILKFAKEYKLTGNFKDIENIARHGQSEIEMKSFDKRVMKTCGLLKHLGKDKAECLDVFVQCGALIAWLKESMKSGLKELKVFVDLAFMSAGEEPLNISRVQCLHSAVTGYGPLIFDLKPSADFRMLLDKCELVWRELEANPKLPIQMMDTNRQVEWLNNIKKAHGSVEVTSLVQADAINARGIYTVGIAAWKTAAGSNIEDIADVMKLTVPEEEGKTQLRNYTLSQLQDLQSRLMLVAGKAEKSGGEGVEIFTSVFDSIIRLTNVYRKLCASGCVLFKEWTARFFCLQKRDLCAILEFGQSEEVPKLKGHRNEKEDLKEFIPQIANFMEACYEDWLKYIKEKRKEYLHLNFFTVDQLVILQRELVKCGTEEEVSHLVYPLLSAVKQDCTPEDLISAMSDAKSILDYTVEMETDVEVTDHDEMTEKDIEEEQRQTFIQEIMNTGYSEQLAVKALEHVSSDNVDDGIVWCMDHCDDEDEMTVEDEADLVYHSTGPSTMPSFSGWNLQTDSSIQAVIAGKLKSISGTHSGNGVKPLLEELRLLWKEFLGSISSNVKDYLSLEHLGLILRYLASKDTANIERIFPHGYLEGAPNLLICPSADVLPMVLSLYMMTKDQPLPLPDEVLLCTSHTTVDEVDIFWRRALFGDERKIYCLVNADMLDYEVSDTAERHLEEYLQSGESNKLYRLVVICGSDNEYRSRIVSSLDKHCRTPLPIILPQIQDYLATKLQVNEQYGRPIPAAHVDFNRSTVRLIKSWRSGVGKTLYKERREEDLSKLNSKYGTEPSVSIPLQEKKIDLHSVMDRLLDHTSIPGKAIPKIFHINVAHEVQYDVDYLLFNLLVLGCVMDRTGYVWRKSPADLYLIETMPLMIQSNTQKAVDLIYVHKMLSLLPEMTCRSPQESLDIYTKTGRQPKDYQPSDQLFDEAQFHSPVFQRPFQYLFRHEQGKELKNINPDEPEADQKTCLQTLLRHCGVQDPSWAELHHFVWFLNTQLQDFERSDFMSSAAAEEEFLPGFAKFVLRFMIQMSRDFSTRSLNMSEESPGMQFEPMDNDDEEERDLLQQFQMRRTWESSPHPYLFFNYGGHTFTFLGFSIEKATGNLIDQETGQVLEKAIMARNLYDTLVHNKAPVQENFDALPRDKKIEKLCSVMGMDNPHDPDDTYELTTDNVKKILAIFMRFRCDIPVIIMGETGCGKTRLVKFMCSLQMPPGVDVSNMVLMKVHGGTTNADIERKVKEAEKLAVENVQKYGSQMYTVLFFDEANTTESIGLIKEIMCDKSMEGKKLKLSDNLKMVAACNPYRKHSEELINKLEQAGLGYHVRADKTSDKLGRVPMRRLVYRVQPLPQSLLPLVWDFGQLNTKVEDLYIRQMVRRYIREDKLPATPGLIEVISSVMTASQDYMRKQNNECSFVSLRDVDRVLSVMSWFYNQSNEQRTLYNAMDKKWTEDQDSDVEDSEDEMEEEEELATAVHLLDDTTRSLVLALGVCYHACLRDRQQYRECVAIHFREPCTLTGGADQIEKEILFCQEVFLDNVQLQKNIAKNMALKENVFMMVVCIELRIPLFLVGKPGSSKSLAKTIVSDAMQGNSSRKILFKDLMQAQMVSFQCSPLSTPDGIVGTFRQCAQFQKDKDLSSFVSIVVLDEVGLAEDSPRMPLKTLHPLLEDGCQGDEKPEEYKKVAFIGISNWALDPAKMNRGILVQREVPNLEELENSARGICSTKQNVLGRIEPLIEPMAESYLELFNEATKQKREFYGLRDFYSLVKMVYAFAEKSKQKPTWHEMYHAIKRNFGGLDQIDPITNFRKHLSTIVPIDQERKPSDPDCTPAGLIQACLFDTNKMKSESRYLLLLTENYGALTILQQEILSRQSDIRPITIFGSSFRCDQEYTQVCRNINKIKVCMETGNTVVLLNLENLYESLYDALNQYYVYFGGERYVDLGLGTHRVKCPVHRNFRLIVVAEKQTVYDQFPIPLINRLEKHFLSLSNLLSLEQQELVEKLERWAESFVKQNIVVPSYRRSEKQQSTKTGDVFMGFHDDTCSAVVLHVWKTATDGTSNENVFQAAKEMLLWCATPDAVIRLDKCSLPADEAKAMKNIYFREQAHESIAQYLHQKLVVEHCEKLYAQVTTHSKLLASFHRQELSQATGLPVSQIALLDTLSSFDTEQQFSNKIKQHFKQCGKEPSLLLVQCDSGDINANLVACARYCVMDEIESFRGELLAHVHVVFIVQLPNIAGGCFTGFQCGVWHSVHIDDLWSTDSEMPTVLDMQGKSIATLFQTAVGENIDMDTETVSAARADLDEEMDWEMTSLMKEHGTDNSMNMSNFEMEQPVPSTSKADQYTLDTIPLQLEDVVIGLETIGHQQTSRKSLNVRGLVLSCVQAALSMVKDRKENTARTTDRVRLVLKLFHQKSGGDQSFLQGVCKLIANLLKAKETLTHGGYMANDWLINEAAKFENIHKAGTFRRACIQTLEAKIAPILAGIIAFVDTNENLDLLQDPTSNGADTLKETVLSWKQKFWLNVLNTNTAIPLKYTDLQSPKRQSDLQEVIVLTTGCDGQMFTGQMPFSWLLHQQLGDVLKTPLPHSEEEADLDQSQKVEFYVGVMKKNSLGELLTRLQDDEVMNEVMMDYISDFIHMMCKVVTSEEHQLICRSVGYMAKQIAEQIPEGSLLHRLVSVHFAYSNLEPRLVHFHQMNCVWPQCSSTIIKLKDEHPDHFMFREEEFTFSALCLLIENLNPVRDSLNNPESRSKWLKTVHQYRQVVEKVIGLYMEDPIKYGAHSEASIKRARGLWTRVVVVKLFLEHVCAAGDKEKITIKYCMPFWKILGAEADLKTSHSLEAVEKFLRTCNKIARKEFLGKEEKCCQCDAVLEGPPIVFPCKDIVCDNCWHDWQSLGEDVCPKCKRDVDKNWNPERQIHNREAVEKMRDYQRRCNSFFMDVVSQLSFADNQPPSKEVIEKLVKYVLCSQPDDHKAQRGKMTKEMSIFETGIDPNPVFRSFLLQLLMRVSHEEASANLEIYLSQAAMFIREDDVDREQHYIQLCLLVIQCFEDILLQESFSSGHRDAEPGNTYLRRAIDYIDQEDLSVGKLCALAETRIGLAITAKYIAEIIKHKQKVTQQDTKVRRLIEAAQNVCEDVQSKWPRIYLIKHLCRCYGVDMYKAVCQSEKLYLRWIIMTDFNNDERIEGPDRYVVGGELYTTIREALTKVVLGEDVQHLVETLQGMAAAHAHVEAVLQLAVHREITNSFLYPEHQRKVTANVIETLEENVVTNDIVKNKELLQALLHNQIGLGHLTVVEKEDVRHQSIQCLVQHFISVISGLQGERTVMQPLIALVRNPQTCREFFLPTMPQDDLDDVRAALLAARNAGGDNNPVFYRCPNGHPYVIGDCGRAMVVAKCPTCKEDIGGTRHTLLQTNKLDQGVDQTAVGHILGRAEARGQGPRPERTLTPAYCACLRLLTHMAMYVGTASNVQSIQALIKPDIEANAVPEFLWQHILVDIDDIQRGVGRSVDDALLLLHTVIDFVLRNHSPADVGLGNDHIKLATKRGRQEWEERFSATYLQPALQNVDDLLARSNQLITQDHRLGADPLLCLLYETDTQQETVSPGMLQDAPVVWRYRTPISLDHLRQEFEAQIVSISKEQQKLEVLQLFLKEDHHLRAIRHIPSILKLQQRLFNKYQRRLDKAEATAITIRRMKQEMDADIGELIASFAEAWELIREDLKLYMCPTDLGGVVVSKEYCTKSITDDMPVAILLPTTKEMGLCSYALLDFLMRKQNNFLDKYITASKRRHISLTSVSPRDITAAHLISYNPQQDILPLVLANCKYSFEMGKGTKIEYDFEGLEKQLMDRFLFSKSKIEVGSALQIEQMVYRAEITDAIVFKKLAEKIPQESLNAAVKSQISSEFKSLPDVCTSLDNLDIAISFLTSVGGDPQQSLNEFMVNTLKMENSLTSQKARQECQFKHVQSLWLLLCLLKSKQIADHKQSRESMFESVGADYHEDLPDAALQQLKDYVKPISIDNLFRFVEVLHECIVLVVAVKENPDDEDYQDMRDNKLRDFLYAYLEGMDQPPQDLMVMQDFPEDILLRHCVHTWTEAYHLLIEKKTGNGQY